VKTFPIQRDPRFPSFPRDVPWPLAEEAYEHYTALFGTDQSLARLAERSGFGVIEFVLLLAKQNPAHRVKLRDRLAFVGQALLRIHEAT